MLLKSDWEKCKDAMIMVANEVLGKEQYIKERMVL
jgi:hypothetical protein